MAQSSPDIFAQGIDVVFALPEGDIEHELSLRCWLKPECGKLQNHNAPAIQEIYNPAPINRIARQSVWMPCQNPTDLTLLYARKHRIEYRTARNFGRLLFHKFLDNIEIVLFGKGAQFCDLGFNAQNLFILHISGLAGVQKEFLWRCVFHKLYKTQMAVLVVLNLIAQID
ncbi:MAG: hypothetical protein HYV77_03315 [Candidatus Wildermuthbacteria bacterium]|nr:hypothetical protein [Candidatus Wildermuthbacteria bacterium]